MEEQIMSGSGRPYSLSVEPDENEIRCNDCNKVRNKSLKDCPMCEKDV